MLFCLKWYHISQNCRSSVRCSNCRGRHHTSIYSSFSSRAEQSNPATNIPVRSQSTSNTAAFLVATSASLHVNCQMPILLLTAKAVTCDTSQGEIAPKLEVRAILDLGSQWSYVTARIRELEESEIRVYGYQDVWFRDCSRGWDRLQQGVVEVVK